MTYHSEHGQDRWLEENVFRGKRNGVFVELGALDGVSYSNTLFFERDRGWRGVLIEANPLSFALLLRAGSRPGARKVLAAISADIGIAEFTAVRGVSGWSGLTHEMDVRHVGRIVDGSPDVAGFLAPTLPLATILAHCGLEHVDYLSLDVEGAELPVLHGIDFNACDIDVLDVENNYDEPVVEEFLRTFGYRKIHTIAINDIYRKS